jgi:hypothetical protein
LRDVQNVSILMGRGGDAAHQQPTPETDMTRAQAATEYRRLRRLFIDRQHSLCTIYGQRATVDSFDEEAARYLEHVCGYEKTPANFVYAARAMLSRIMPDHDASAA